ncbi:30S ribosome-binding factor RbfA [Gilvibacter sp. SZ-19]|jgi:ribosome-binding factor A|uniref:30S ribosome-binding factor RbfA n=1 Tax=unclassified Gilvibacter TaxID=2625242 RepID=UPI000B3D2ABA|nr:30S ribosome-binding factor RbfA [Gilvibacter sp. SZ-19]ARV11885.1 ribosome-binding factor A [Gilvibacter sp. SZ-19]
MNENNRQKKIAGILQSDIATLIQKMLREAGQTQLVVSVTKVNVTVDLSIAKVYLSIFPAAHAKAMMEEIKTVTPNIKHQLAQLTRDQLRKMPDLIFYLDDSLEYIESIDKALEGEVDPVKNPDLLGKRKKS